MRRRMRFEVGFETDAHRPSPNSELWSSALPDAGHGPAGDQRSGSGHLVYRISYLYWDSNFRKSALSENGLRIRSGFSRAPRQTRWSELQTVSALPKASPQPTRIGRTIRRWTDGRRLKTRGLKSSREAACRGGCANHRLSRPLVRRGPLQLPGCPSSRCQGGCPSSGCQGTANSLPTARKLDRVNNAPPPSSEYFNPPQPKIFD
jgi:hypothetical protein